MLTEDFIREALQLRQKRDYKGALAQLDKAISLDPTSPSAHRYRGQTLSYQAAREPGLEKEPALTEALASIERAVQLQGGESPDTLHDKAWIADERGEYERAIELYREARALARTQGRRDTRNVDAFSYNLACALAKSGRQEQALAELHGLPPELLQIARDDSDFEVLRTKHAAQFDALWSLAGSGGSERALTTSSGS